MYTEGNWKGVASGCLGTEVHISKMDTVPTTTPKHTNQHCTSHSSISIQAPCRCRSSVRPQLISSSSLNSSHSLGLYNPPLEQNPPIIASKSRTPGSTTTSDKYQPCLTHSRIVWSVSRNTHPRCVKWRSARTRLDSAAPCVQWDAFILGVIFPLSNLIHSTEYFAHATSLVVSIFVW